jgi:hypothetical protein
MLNFFTYLFVIKTVIMYILIQQTKEYSVDSGFFHEILLAVIHPGIFGVVLLFFVVVGNIAKILDKEDEK